MKKLCATIAAAVLAITGYFAWQFLVTPQYGWLVFGPEGHVRMLLRANGGSIDLDLNRNGRFGTAERFTISSAGPLSIPVFDGKTSYLITKMSRYDYDRRQHLTIEVA